MEISPDIEARLRLRATAQGVTIEDYLRALMERDVLARSPGRDYNSDEISEMLEADTLSPEMLEKAQRLLVQ
jgi:hypothetical protein